MTEVKENPEGTDNPAKEDIQSPSQKRKEVVKRESFLNSIVLKGLLNFNSSVNIWTYLSQNQMGSYGKVVWTWNRQFSF